MRIKLLKPHRHGREDWLADAEKDAPDDVAVWLIERQIAKEVKPTASANDKTTAQPKTKE